MEDIEFLITQNNLLPAQRPPSSIAAWVENRRVLPASSPFPGPWRNERTPYSVEIMDNMSPWNPCQKQAIMKARKLGLTTAIENCVAYYISESPAEQLYSTANEQLAKDWSKKKISHVIDSLGIRHKLIAADQNTKSRATGDRMFTKEYIGGALDIITASSLMARRALDKRCLWIDETDGIEAQTSTGEGNWAEIIMAHTNSYGARRKISLFGSPTTDESSLIKYYYEQGDRRKYLVPCPNCGRHIELKLDDEVTTWGLKAETKEGKIIDAYYICEYCGDPIWDNDKLIFFSPEPHCRKTPRKKIAPARWEPENKSDPVFRSYQINSLYSPVGMLSFRDVAVKQNRAQSEGADAKRSFVNIYMGLPYKHEGTRPQLIKVMEHRGTYQRGTVPAGVLFLTMAVDVQEGEARNPDKPERLELEVMGTGLGYRTWSIDYRVFEGSTEDPYSGAWEELYRWMKSIDGTFYSASRIPFRVQMIFIDSGDASKTKAGVSRSDIVYRFTERWSPFAFPIKGFSQLSARRGEKADTDIAGRADFKRYRKARIGSGGEYVVEISTVHYKSVLFARLNINQTETETHPNAYCDFPRDYSDDYFIQLTNTERLEHGFKDTGAHEALDVRVYNLCASDAWLDTQVSIARDEARKSGADPVWAEMSINSRTILERLQSQLLAYGAAIN